jgi:DNA polymerase V
VVLSNNDGCAVARSNEAKALGIKMGAPWFQIKHFAESAGLVALSANFALYGDLSDRMMSLAAGLGPTQEIYSIDESFIEMSGVRGDLVERSRRIRARILQWVGIPCGIGIGATKTLAKLANHVSKSAERKPGSYPDHMAQVCNLAALSPLALDAVFAATAVNEVWGVGPRITKQLLEGGVRTVSDLVKLDAGTIRRRWSVMLERTVRELQGTPCIDFEDAPAPKQQIACTRSFGHPVTELASLNEAVTEFASRGAEKLRKQESLAGQVMVFIRTSPFRQDPQYSRSMTVPLRRPSSDTAVIVAAALIGLAAIYKPGFRYAKAGIMLMELQPGSVQQGELDLEGDDARDRGKLMLALDGLNQRYGKGSVLMASAGLGAGKRLWSMKQERRTPGYTTRWADVPVVRA